jgi:hypothetical protein
VLAIRQDPPSPLRRRFWVAGLALALFLTTAAVGNSFLPADRAVSLRSAGFDFLAFYTGGTFVRTGQAEKLYDLDAVRAFQQDLAREQGLELRSTAVGPFWNPPFYAWVFAPLSALPYPAAFFCWTMLNVACLGGAMFLLCRMLAVPIDPSLRGNCMGEAPMPRWQTWGLIPLLTLTSMPLIMAIGHGQNACVSLLILCGAIALWRGGRCFGAGAVAGLLFYKPQLGLVVAAVMIACCGRRALAGLASTGAALLLVTIATLPGALAAFIEKTQANLATMQIERPYLWDRHVTLKSFWRLLVQGYEPGPTSTVTTALWLGTSVLLAACAAACVCRLRRRDDEIARDRAISVAILSMPLLMPFYFDYDLLLLAVPAVLAARRHDADGRVIAAWVALYAWLMVNPHVAALTRVNGTVVLLAALAGVTMARAMRESRATTAVREETAELTPLPRAA